MIPYRETHGYLLAENTLWYPEFLHQLISFLRKVNLLSVYSRFEFNGRTMIVQVLKSSQNSGSECGQIIKISP